jgi:nucleotide-binding universal stress UspA family protein
MAVEMDASTDHGLSFLWASDGRAECIGAAATIGGLILPSSREITILTVAPQGGLGAPIQRALHRTYETQQVELETASQAASLSLAALPRSDKPVRTRLAWGYAPQEIVREADDCEADVIVLCNRPHGQLRSAVVPGTAAAVIESTRRSVLVARPGVGKAAGPVIVVLNTPRRFVIAVELLRRLKLPDSVAVLLVAFDEPAQQVPSIFPTYRRRSTLVRDGISGARRQALRSVLLQGACMLAQPGRKIDFVISDEGPLNGLRGLVAETGASVAVVGDAPFGLSSDRQTLSPITLATQLACSILVAR